jgi:acetyl esterase
LKIKPLPARHKYNAAMTQLPLPMQQLMARIGPLWGTDIRGHSQMVMGAYAPLLAAANNEGMTVTRDVAYGPHARQVLDIFQPPFMQNAGVVVFVHGGAFVRGDKQASPEMYDNLLYWFAKQGYLGINIEYRLAPESAYPGGADDVAQAMAWLHVNAAAHGGDPAKMFLIGHSAGGTHVASYVFDPALGYLGQHTAGAVLISARLRADVSPENPNAEGVRAYFGDDPARYEQRSPVSHAASSRLPVFIVTTEFENPLLDVYGLEMAYQLSLARRQAPRYRQMRGHNHMSVVAHFNSGEDALGREIVDFFETVGLA